MTRFILPVFTALCITGLSTVEAQSYKTAVGLRIDNGVHLTAQQYLLNNWTAEAVVHTAMNSEDLGLTLLAERHHKLLVRNLNFYYGLGGHYYWSNGSRSEPEKVQNNVYGLSAIGGLELSLGRFNLALDWKPELHLSGGDVNTFGWNGSAFSARYILFKREKKKVKDWNIWKGFKKEK